MKRQRGRGRKGNGQQPNRNFESNGPGIKIRGSANHIYEKYLQLARDELSSGDRVMAESYLQHAEHYYRVLASMHKGAPPPRSEHDPREMELAGFDDDDEDDEATGAEAEEHAETERAPGFDAPPREQRPQDGRSRHDGVPRREDQRRDDFRRDQRRDGRPDHRGEVRPEGGSEHRPDGRPDARRDGRREPRPQPLASITPLTPANTPLADVDPLPLQTQNSGDELDRLPAFLSAGPTSIGDETPIGHPTTRRRRRRRPGAGPGLFQGEGGDAEAEAALDAHSQPQTVDQRADVDADVHAYANDADKPERRGLASAEVATVGVGAQDAPPDSGEAT